jgi:hypothetical protein
MNTNTFSTRSRASRWARGFWGRCRQVGYGWLGIAVLAAVLWVPEASGQSSPCAQFKLDGVTLNLCQSFVTAPVISTAAPTDAIQMATAVDRSNGYKELSITAIPFGRQSPAEDLPAAQANGAATYRTLLNDYRTQQGGQPKAGPTTTFFGQAVPSLISTANLPVRQITPEPVTITEWVVEAGSRLWIIRALQSQPTGLQALSSPDLSLSSPNVAQPSSSSLAAQTLPQSQSVGQQAVTAAGDLMAPWWWNGETCDYTHYTTNSANPARRTPYALGASYRGVLACGPRPYYDSAPDVIVQFDSGAWGQYEWECVELSMRFMRLAYGIRTYSGNGKDVVWNYTGSELVKIVNGTTGEVPAPGDILSYCNGCVSVGHTSVVSNASVNASGYGTIDVIEQNNSWNGANTLTVSNWVVGRGVTGWLHFPGNGSVSGMVKKSNGDPAVGAQVRLEKWLVDLTTTTDGNGAYFFDNIPAGSASVTATYADGCGSAAGSVTASIVAHQNQPASDIVMADYTGSLSGAVKNTSGQPVVGAQVTFSHCSVTRSATTDSNGAYSFAGLPTGTGKVRATYAPGSCSASGEATANISADENLALPNITLAVPALYDAAFVADVTFPDQAVFAPGQALVKTWRLRNTGCLTWDSSYKLAFVHGDTMGGGDASVPTTPMGQTADLTVNLTAPLNGSHFGYWNLRNPQGVYFGPLVFPQVNVQTPSPYLTLQVDPPAPATTSRVRISAWADSLPNFGAMRLLIDGVPVVQASTPELYYTWNTAGYSAIGHSLVVEAIRRGDQGWSHPERRGLVYMLLGDAGGGGNPNFTPDRPTLVSPPDWDSAISSTLQLCAQGSDANSNALQYQYEISNASGLVSTSGWVTGCFTSPSLNPGTYTWRAKAKDPAGAQSVWSLSQHASLVTGSAGVTRFDAVPVDADQVRLGPCTSLTEPVTLSVRVNTAADGSGRWDLVGELAGACAPANAGPVWNTLPYADGTHRLRLVATSPAGAVMSDTVFTLAPRRPSAPALLSPAINSGSIDTPVYLSSRTLNFRWEAAARALNYRLLVSLTPSPQSDPAPLVNQTLAGDVIAYNVTLNADYATLYWQVVATNASGANVSSIQRLSIDRTQPTCQLQSTPRSANTWQVSWAGLDDSGGIAAFNLRYIDPDTHELLNWLTNLPATVTSTIFTGQPGRSYGFWCQALDLAGNDSDRRRYLPVIRR